MVGDIQLEDGGSVHYRGFGVLNLTLWDDMITEFEEQYGRLTENDVIMFNFGAWYPRFRQNDWWSVFKFTMAKLIETRLQHMTATVYWKEYAPAHFGGRTGTWTGIEESLSDVLPVREACEPAQFGEYWYNDWIKQIVSKCGMPCSHIRILPIFNLSLARYNLHHGSFGRGTLAKKPVRDCRHYCQPVVDLWSIVFFNSECFGNLRNKNRIH
eukprot:jgi/Botrbrau1/10131/Bobra.0191s0004.1